MKTLIAIVLVSCVTSGASLGPPPTLEVPAVKFTDLDNGAGSACMTIPQLNTLQDQVDAAVSWMQRAQEQP